MYKYICNIFSLTDIRFSCSLVPEHYLIYIYREKLIYSFHHIASVQMCFQTFTYITKVNYSAYMRKMNRKLHKSGDKSPSHLHLSRAYKEHDNSK